MASDKYEYLVNLQTSPVYKILQGEFSLIAWDQIHSCGLPESEPESSATQPTASRTVLESAFIALFKHPKIYGRFQASAAK